MAWLRGYREREPITLITVDTAATSDVTVTIPPSFDLFWGTVDVDGDGVRFTRADGVTPIAYRVSSFNRANRVGVFELEDAPLPAVAARAVLAWIYFAPTEAPTDGTSAFTASTPIMGRFALGRPSRADVFLARREPPRRSTPQVTISKAADTDTLLYVDVSSDLQQAVTRFAGRLEYEEPGVGQVAVLDDAGVAVPAMIVAGDLRWVQVRTAAGRRLMLRQRIRGGTSGEVYTLLGRYSTESPEAGSSRDLQSRIGIAVQDVLEV